MAPVGEDRFNMRLDVATRRRLDALAARLELRQADIVRMAIRQMAEREGLESPAPGAPADG